MTYSILTEGLVKRFGQTVALDGIDLAVRTGSVFGLLGPNGAGKTTAVRILATLVAPDAGRAMVCGHDVVRHAHQVRQLTGLTGQYASVDETLTGTENLVLIGRLTGQSRPAARARARDLLAAFRLADAADRAVKTYSGGMRRRLDLAASLVSRPRVLYLDEPTTGLDPRSRGEMYDIVRGLAATGVTVLLTTQYLEEADQLADEIAVIDHGTVIATGTPTQLKDRTDLEKGFFDRLRSLPIARFAPLAGRIAADVAKQAWALAMLIGLGYALGFRVGTNPLAVLAAAGLVLVSTLAVSWALVLVAMLAANPEKVQIFGFVVLFPITFTSDAFVRTASMPGWLQAWAKANPVSLISDAMRGLMVSGPVARPAVESLLSKRAIAARPKSVSATSASAGPRQSTSASRSVTAAAAGSASSCARPAAASSSNRTTSVHRGSSLSW